MNLCLYIYNEATYLQAIQYTNNSLLHLKGKTSEVFLLFGQYILHLLDFKSFIRIESSIFSTIGYVTNKWAFIENVKEIKILTLF